MQWLGFSNPFEGLVVGGAFPSTVLTRAYAGGLTGGS